MQYIPVEFTVKIATICIAALEMSSYTFGKLYEIFVACCSVFHDKEFLFFEGGTHPYPVSAVSPWATGSATPVWQYNATKKLFIEWGDTIQNKRHTLPYLSLEVVHGSRVQYDLTEFIEGIRVQNRTNECTHPTLPQLLSAWTASSGIVLQPTRFIVRVITEEGDTQEFTMDGKRWVAEAEEPAAEETKED